MQFNFVAVALAALMASTAAFQNGTITGGSNSTNASHPTTPPSSAPELGAAFHNAVSGGLLGAVVAAGLALARYI